jgi:hypothetical protein
MSNGARLFGAAATTCRFPVRWLQRANRCSRPRQGCLDPESGWLVLALSM